MIVGIVVDLVVLLGIDVDTAVDLALKGAIDVVADVSIRGTGIGAVVGERSVGPILA